MYRAHAQVWSCHHTSPYPGLYLRSIRKTHEGILDYTDLDVQTDDVTGLLRIEKKDYVILYNTKDSEIFIDELKLKMELITGAISDGYMEGYSVFVYKK